MDRTRFLWLTGSGVTVLLLTLLLALSPVQVQLTIASRPEAAEAGLPTTTPMPATAVPPTAIPATATPAAPTSIPASPVPPTPEPRRERRQPSPTPEPSPELPLWLPPQLVIEKRSSVATVLPGDTLAFTLLIANHGEGPASDVVVTDELPAQFEVIDLYSSKGDIVVEGQRVSAFPRRLEAGEEQSYTISVRVRNDASPGQIANTAIITSSSDGDEPGDNTSTITVEVRPPVNIQTVPPKLPRTADPRDPDQQPFLALYWPLLVLACGLIGFGAATHYGLFRRRTIAVTVGAAPPAASAQERAELRDLAVGIQLDPQELVACWRRGAATHALVDLVAQHNPHANRLAISIAVQRVLRACME